MTGGNLHVVNLKKNLTIKAIQPHCAVIGSQTPLADNYRSKGLLHRSDVLLLMTGVGVEPGPRGGIEPRLVNVRVKGSIRAAEHEASPYIGVKSKGIMNNVFPVRRLVFYD